MRKLLALAVLVTSLVGPGALAGADTPTGPGGDLFTPEPIETAVCWSCAGSYTTSPGGGAASHWGMGSSCSAAQTDFNSQTGSAANQVCWGEGAEYACAISRVVTAACFWNGSMYQIDGYANFKCRFWTGGPGCIIP